MIGVKSARAFLKGVLNLESVREQNGVAGNPSFRNKRASQDRSARQEKAFPEVLPCS
jgi:hypothetical protein